MSYDQSSKRAKKDRASRNAARRRAIREGLVQKGGKEDIDHINGNPRDNSPGNLQVMDRKKNRGAKRVAQGRNAMKDTKKTTAAQAMPKGKVPKKKKPFSFRKKKGSPLSTFADLRAGGKAKLKAAGE